MDYSIGSLADLITGSNTPNKPKVVTKKFKKINQPIIDTSIPLESKEIDSESVKVKSLKSKKVKKSLSKLPKEKKNGKKQKFKTTEDDNTKPFNKKRKLESSNSPTAENEPSPKIIKLSVNEQNAERRIKHGGKVKNRMDVEELERTIYVGNVPIQTDKKKIKRHFKKYGEIESLRIRGVPVADPKVSKKVAAIKKEFNPNRKNIYFYIRFADKEDAIKAEVENGALFEGHHLRVHVCSSKGAPDESKAIFVGNLKFDAIEDDLWQLFEMCGPISHVRIIRDGKTGMGKGFGYVNFKDSDSVQLALEMENVKLGDRELRISLSNLRVARKKKSKNSKMISKPGKPNEKKTGENGPEKNTFAEKQIKKSNVGFQGTKFADKRKKHKVNKGLLQKKKMVMKLAPNVSK